MKAARFGQSGRTLAAAISVALAAILSAATAPAAAQAAEERVAPVVFLDDDHWLIPEIVRLDALGLLPEGVDAARRTPTLTGALADLAAAAEAAEAAGSPEAPLIHGLLRRLEREGGGVAASLEAGYGRSDGAYDVGWGYRDGYPDADRFDAERRPPEAGASWRVSASIRPLSWLSGHVSVAEDVSRRDPDPGTPVQAAYATVRMSNVVAWAGIRPFSYGPGRSGSLVLDGAAPFPSAGLRSEHPFRLPGFLAHAGPVTLEAGLGVRDFAHSFDDVGLLVTRGSIAPHRRLSIGVTRAALFGGHGNTAVDVVDVLFLLVGKHAGDISELDNQVVSLDAQYRPPTEQWLPLRLYTEWGFEDSANAWWNVPGILAGIEIPSFPGLPGFRIGLEHVVFAPSCCGNPIWYRHAVFQDGWAVEQIPLGHPLAGHGAAWSVLMGSTAWNGRLRVDAELFRRDRREENLYDPRLGTSVGGSVAADISIGGPLDAVVRADLEDGSGWRSSAVSIGFRAVL